MIRFWAIIGNTFREGIAKKTIITILVLCTLIIGFYAFTLNVAGDMMFIAGFAEFDELPDQAIRMLEAGVTTFFYQVAFFVGIFSVVSFYPSMQEKGTIDLLLSRPMSRFSIFTAKFIGCFLLVLLVLSYIILGTWLVFKLKTGIAHVEYLYTIPIFMVLFLAFMAFIAMIGTISRSATLSAILAIFIPYIFSLAFYGLHRSPLLKGYHFWRGLIDGIYWALPKTWELPEWNIRLILNVDIPNQSDLFTAAWTTLAFAAVCYLVGYLVFWKRSY